MMSKNIINVLVRYFDVLFMILLVSTFMVILTMLVVVLAAIIGSFMGVGQSKDAEITLYAVIPTTFAYVIIVSSYIAYYIKGRASERVPVRPNWILRVTHICAIYYPATLAIWAASLLFAVYISRS